MSLFGIAKVSSSGSHFYNNKAMLDDYKECFDFSEIHGSDNFTLRPANLPYEEIVHMIDSIDLIDLINGDEIGYQLTIGTFIYHNIHENQFFNDFHPSLIDKLLSFLGMQNILEFPNSLMLTLNLLSLITKNHVACLYLSEHSHPFPPFLFLRDEFDSKLYGEIMKKIISIFYHIKENNIEYENIVFFGGISFADILHQYISSDDAFSFLPKFTEFIDLLNEEDFYSVLNIIKKRFTIQMIQEKDILFFNQILKKYQSDVVEHCFLDFAGYFYRVSLTEEYSLQNLCLLVFNTYISSQSNFSNEMEKFYNIIFEIDSRKLASLEYMKSLVFKFIQFLLTDLMIFLEPSNEEIEEEDNDILGEEMQISSIYTFTNLEEGTDTIMHLTLRKFSHQLAILASLDQDFVIELLKDIGGRLDVESFLWEELHSNQILWEEIMNGVDEKDLEILNDLFSFNE